ncbi:6452_t:CDS:2 [Funneliformis geosporum]|uniref:6452_t:CDS:1 n=1 Tax=Funneliformis geosporum TaxID=1117311 RepID=A0A9W4WU04_9GLOM|nr:6452_t:CDS:2 [Funneliformis geosporum]
MTADLVHIDISLNYEIVSYDLYREPDVLEKFVTKIKKKLLNIQTDLSNTFLKSLSEALQKFEEAKYRLLEVNE